MIRRPAPATVTDSSASPASPAAKTATAPTRVRPRGQILIIFAMAMVSLTGMVALVIDVSWYWVNSLSVQRAADAAALAGVVYLPGDPTSAYAVAKLESAKNGYTDAVASVAINPVQEPPGNGRRLNVTIEAHPRTFFMRIFGINDLRVVRTGKAEFVLPVPMGSPENYYGVFGLTRGLTTTGTTTTTNHASSSSNSGFDRPSNAPGTVGWVVSNTSVTLTNGVASEDAVYAQTDTNLKQQQWGDFGLLDALAGNQTVTAVTGIEVRLGNAGISGSCSNSNIQAFLSWNNGASWSTAVTKTASLTTSTSTDYTLGSSTSVSAWTAPGHTTWTEADINDTNFRVKLQANKGCTTSGRNLRVDRLEVRVTYTIDTVTTTTSTTTTAIPDENLRGPGTACAGVVACYNADGATLNPRGFWATMNTEGSANVNGDAFQPYYDVVGGAQSPSYDATTYYNYAVEIPAGATGGSVYVYDPVFCATTLNKGTADRWFSGSGDPVSSFYELYDSKNTLYDMDDDGVPVATWDPLESTCRHASLSIL